jgi:hypothetical protein
MGATFDAGAPLDNAKLNEIIAQLEILKTGQTGLSASIQGVKSSVDSSATSAVAKKLLAGQTTPRPFTLKNGVETTIPVPYVGTLTGACAAFIYSLAITPSKNAGVDVSSAIISAGAKEAKISVQKTTAGTDTYIITVHYLAIAATE